MASIFNTLNVGYSGLSAAQVGINVTGHNISNSEVDGYTRQRVSTAASTPLKVSPGNVGNGVEVKEIKRVFDAFVFDRYSDISADKESSEFSKKTLETLSTFFPEIDGVGIKSDMSEYYKMWQTFADNPDNDSIKLALTKQTEVLSSHIKQNQEQVRGLQTQLNEELKVNIDEVNSIAKELALVNKSIDTAEAGDFMTANDLRDKRNVLERDLSKLIGANINDGQIEANTQNQGNINERTGSYTVSVNGFNIVDGSTYHPIHISNENNANEFYEISYERQDGVLIPLEEVVTDGKIGAILDLRGGTIDNTEGIPKDGIIQNVVAELDSFATTLIESTNNLYASSSTTRMDSNHVDLNPTNAVLNSSLNVKEGSFSVLVYDNDGNEVAKRSINIDIATTMTGAKDSNSIEGQFLAEKDDNDDGNANNDIDDFVSFNWATLQDGDGIVELTLDPLAESKGYTFSIEDNLKDDTFSSGTNFAGALGLHRFFDGTDASSIDLHSGFKINPTTLSAGKTSSSGDNDNALNMVQHQFENYNFTTGKISYDTTAYGMFDIISTEVGTATNGAILKEETVSTQFNAVELEYFSASKVNIDEEMTNLIKYQTSYGAAAKVITTIDQMMQTLLGIKQ